MVVVEGDGEVVEEREDALGVVAEAVEEIEGFGLLGAHPAFGSAGRLGSGILCVAFFDDAIVSGKEGNFFGVGKGLELCGAGVGDGLLDGEQVVDHGLGPNLLVLLVEEDEFAQQVGVAEGVGAVVFEVGFPEVVDGTALEGGQDAGGIRAWVPRFLWA